jgi:hypothetical protein
VNRIQRATTGPVRSLDGARPRRVGDDDNSRILMTRLPGWLRVPASVRDQGFTNRYVASAVAAVGLVVAAVAVRGHRTQGRSAFYQNALLGFGLHGLGHIGMSLLTRGYTSGVATSPIIVMPFCPATKSTEDMPSTRNNVGPQDLRGVHCGHRSDGLR